MNRFLKCTEFLDRSQMQSITPLEGAEYEFTNRGCSSCLSKKGADLIKCNGIHRDGTVRDFELCGDCIQWHVNNENTFGEKIMEVSVSAAGNGTFYVSVPDEMDDGDVENSQEVTSGIYSFDWSDLLDVSVDEVKED